MNILIPYPWLLQYLKTKATPKEIAKYLSLSGPSVERIETVKGDPVFDIEVTTNRVDSMSVYGIAREAATILPEFDLEATLLPLTKGETGRRLKQESLPSLNLTIKNDPELCHRILAVKLENVTIKDSPPLIQKRLLQVGQRPLNNAIDITNYVMWEVGHPIHAFDYDRLTQKTIIVRQAKKGEVFTTLDGKTFQTVGGEVVFDDGTGKIVDLPGIMGTQNTVVTPETKNVLLWIESVDPVKIRYTSITHQIRSQAAVLNEKSVDPNLAPIALNRAIELYLENTKASIGSLIKDIYPRPPKIQTTNLKQELLDTYLGIQLKPGHIKKILTRLGINVQHASATYTLTPPTWRAQDLTIPEDYIEEVARIYGYHRLESKIMATPIPDTPTNADFTLENRVKNWLAGWGAIETYTYSMVSKKLALASGNPLEKHLTIQNPFSTDWEYLRTSLIPSLIEVFNQNPTYQTTLFELQNVYHPAEKNHLPEQILTLTVLSNQSFTHLKGIFEAMMEKLYVQNYTLEPVATHPPFLSNHVGVIKVDRQIIGYLGQLPSSFLSLSGFFLDLYQLAPHTHTHPQTLILNKQPPIIEDLTFTLSPQTVVGPIIETIKQQSRLIQAVELKTVFNQNYTFTLTYRHQNRPLHDAEIKPIRQKIVSTLKNQGLTLVGVIE